MLDRCLNCKQQYKKRGIKRKFCSIICANRFNLNNQSKVELPKPSSELAEFIGICLGDGTTGIYQTAITLNSNVDSDYIPYVFVTAKNLFPGATVSLLERKDNATDVRIFSKIVSTFLKSNGIISHSKFVPSWIVHDKKFIVACLRGLFDTEGSFSSKKYQSRQGIRHYYQLNFRNTNKQIMTFVRDSLINLGHKPTRSLKNSLYLSNAKSIFLFNSTIGFNNPKLTNHVSSIIRLDTS